MGTDHRGPKLPSGLAGVLNAPEESRDSAYFSSTDASSKHTSAASGIGINVFHPVNETTPSPTATTLLPIASPTGNMSVASMVSPTLPANRRFDRPQSLESGAYNGNGGLHPESRRESVDSRINQNFGDMRLGNSPYASQNQSTTSIQGSLAQQRNPRGGLEQLAAHRISNGYQPNIDRTPDGFPKMARTAPAITGPATSHIARAAEPTKGQAWAFPEEEIQRVPSSIATTSFLDSRRSSMAESIASSQFTTESRLPPGQRRLDEHGGPDFSRLSGVSGVSTDYPSVHHHSLQHKQLSDLHSEESSPHSGTQPYSRTPELRVSHKLAERKRRTEMKDLFDQLRDLMPQERGSKASKWEILTKAIAEHQRQTDTIKQLSAHCNTVIQEAESMRRELDRLRIENGQLRGGMGSSSQHQASPSHPGPSQPTADPYAQDQYARNSRPELPPLRALSGSIPSQSDSMTGVQYDSQRTNGYRPERY
ncbi:Myc proto-oncogene protein [Microdochium nivale]|nr:Myc proto-oncogene protein [Microdochium nivale]